MEFFEPLKFLIRIILGAGQSIDAIERRYHILSRPKASVVEFDALSSC